MNPNRNHEKQLRKGENMVQELTYVRRGEL